MPEWKLCQREEELQRTAKSAESNAQRFQVNRVRGGREAKS